MNKGLELYHEIHGEGEPLILLHGGVGAIEDEDGRNNDWDRCRTPSDL
jgi:hypothetical protein